MTENVSQQRLNAILGTTFFILGAILAVLIFLDRWTSIDVSFPDIWYRSRNFHVVLSVVFFIVGGWSHRRAQAFGPLPGQTGVMFQSVRLFTKPDCELCDRALDVMQIYAEHLPDIELVDITGNEELEAQYADTIPVVEIDGRVRFKGIVNEQLLERLIVGRQRQLQVTTASSVGTTERFVS